MTRFADVLDRASERLGVPEPTRSRILLEMASDLEDSYRHHRDRGASEEEAVRLAEEAFGTSDEALTHLARIHAAGVGDLADWFSRSVGAWWARLLLVLLLGFEILLAVKILSTRAFFVFVSPFVWPIGVLAAATIAFTVWKLWQILGHHDDDLRRLRVGLGIPLFFAGASLLISGLGLLFHLQRFFHGNFERAPESLFMNFAGWMAEMSSMMVAGLVTAILAGLLWFVLSSLVSRAEIRRVDILLASTRA